MPGAQASRLSQLTWVEETSLFSERLVSCRTISSTVSQLAVSVSSSAPDCEQPKGRQCGFLISRCSELVPNRWSANEEEKRRAVDEGRSAEIPSRVPGDKRGMRKRGMGLHSGFAFVLGGLMHYKYCKIKLCDCVVINVNPGTILY